MIPFSFQKSFQKVISFSPKKVFLVTTVSALALMIILGPEGWASDVSTTDAKLTTQLDKVSKLASGTLAKTGLVIGTVSSAITAVFKGSWIMALSAFGIGVLLACYLEYLKDWAH